MRSIPDKRKVVALRDDKFPRCRRCNSAKRMEEA
nr:MAG TPA: RNAse domain protein [Caudoviricetes sp.]